MKMAAAEGLYDTQDHAPFSVFTLGSLNGEHHTSIIEVPGPALVPRHRQLQRRDQGHQPAPGRVQGEVRRRPGPEVLLPRQLHADHPGHLLVLPLHDRARAARRRDRDRDPLRHPAGPSPDQRVVAPEPDPAAADADRRQLVRLDLHRDRPAAVGRVRGDDHRTGRLAERDRLRRLDVDDRCSPCCTPSWP